MSKLSIKTLLKAASLFLTELLEEKPVHSSDNPEEAVWMNSVRRKDIKAGQSAIRKLAAGNKDLNEDENLFIHSAVFFHGNTSARDQNEEYDMVEAALNK